MKFTLALLIAATLLPAASHAKSSGDLRFELAKKILEAGPGQCANKNNEAAFFLATSAGFSWNNLHEQETSLDELRLSLKQMKRLRAFNDSSLALKLVAANSPKNYRENRLSLAAAALPGTILHQQDAGGAVTTYLELKAGNKVVLQAIRQTEKSSTGTYQLALEGEELVLTLDFSEEIAKELSGRYILNDKNIVESYAMFDLNSFIITLDRDGSAEFSSERDQTECIDY